MNDDIHKMNEEQLAHYISGWRPGTWHRILAEQELRRRREESSGWDGFGGAKTGVSWLVFGMTAAALLVSLIAL